LSLAAKRVFIIRVMDMLSGLDESQSGKLSPAAKESMIGKIETVRILGGIFRGPS